MLPKIGYQGQNCNGENRPKYYEPDNGENLKPALVSAHGE